MLWIGELVWQDEQCEQYTKDFQCTDTKQAVKIPTRCHVHKQKKLRGSLLNDVLFIYDEKWERKTCRNIIPKKPKNDLVLVSLATKRKFFVYLGVFCLCFFVFYYNGFWILG